MPCLDAKADDGDVLPFYNEFAKATLEKTSESYPIELNDMPVLWQLPAMAKDANGQDVVISSYEEDNSFKVWLYNGSTKTVLKTWTWRNHVRMENHDPSNKKVSGKNLKYTVEELAPAQEVQLDNDPIVVEPVAESKSPYEWTAGWKPSDDFLAKLDSEEEKKAWGGA